MRQPESVLVVFDRVVRWSRVRKGARGWKGMVLAEALERRSLLSAEITVIGPSDVNVTDGQSLDLDPLIGPVVQIPDRVTLAPFTIRNDGDSPLSLGPLVVTGDFSVAANPVANLAAGQTTSLVLGINTAAAGLRTGTISIPNNDSDENPFDLLVSVNVLTSGPEISVQNSAGTELVDGVTPVNFGGAAQGQPGPTQTFTVTNRGALNLALGPVMPPAGYTVIKSLPSGLAPGAQDTLTVQMDTGVLGTRAGVLRIENNDPNENPFDIPVTGTVIAATPAEIAVRTDSQDLVSGQTAVDFGTASVGLPGPTRTFTVTNEGGSNLSLGTLVVPLGFTLTEGLSPLLTPGASDSFTVLMNTSSSGVKSGTIRIPNSDGNENPFNIPVTGTVSGIVTTGPSITVRTDSTDLVNGGSTVDFGSVVQGQTGTTRTFTVSNVGNQVLRLGPVTTPTGYTVSEPLAAALDPGTSDSFTVTLDSGTVGTKVGTISIANNDPAQNPFDIPVTGTVTSPVASGPEIAIRTDSTDLVSGTTTIDFGTAAQGSAGVARTFTVSNVGDTALTLGTASVPSGYTVIKSPTASLAPGASDTLVVQMGTATIGTRAGTISISNNDTNENPFVIPVTGQVVAAEPDIAVRLGALQITDGVTQVNFGTVGLGQPGPTRTFTVTNQGGVSLSLGAVSVPLGYTLTRAPASSSLAPGASDTFVVQMNSTTLGVKSGAIRIASNDPDENPFDIPVTGTVQSTPVVIAPEIVVQLGSRDLTDGVSNVNFGSVVRGDPGPTRTFTVINVGTAALTLGAVNVPSGYTLTEGLVSSLAPGDSDTFTVRLNTTAAGTHAGAIRFANNDPNENPFNIPVTGTVTAVVNRPQVSVSLNGTQVSDGTTQVDFGSVTQGQAGVSRTFTVTNTGTARLTLGTVNVPAGYTLTERLDSALAPGESDSFTVRLNSATLGTKSGNVRFATNVQGANPFNFAVTGSVVSGPVPSPGPVPTPEPEPGTSPEIAVRWGNRSVVDGGSKAFKFGSVAQGRKGQLRIFRVTNTGTATLTLGAVQVPDGFKLVEGLKKALAPGKSDSFAVRLKSGSVGVKDGTITIANNDSNENPFEIAVTGMVRPKKGAAQHIMSNLFSTQRIEDVG